MTGRDFETRYGIQPVLLETLDAPLSLGRTLRAH